MEEVLLVGTVRLGITAALAARGFHLVGQRRSACRAALVAAGGAAPPDLPYLLLVEGDAAAARALDDGADDVADSDAATLLIAARLAALVRRQPSLVSLTLGDLVIDRVERRVTRQGRSITLLPREYALLLFLVRHAGSVVTRAALRESVWGLGFDPGTNVIEVHVSRLRAKLDRGFAPQMLQTEKGVGYRLVAASGAQSPIAAAAIAV